MGKESISTSQRQGQGGIGRREVGQRSCRHAGCSVEKEERRPKKCSREDVEPPAHLDFAPHREMHAESSYRKRVKESGPPTRETLKSNHGGGDRDRETSLTANNKTGLKLRSLGQSGQGRRRRAGEVAELND